MLRSSLCLLFLATSVASLAACGSSESTTSTTGGGGTSSTAATTDTSSAAGTGGASAATSTAASTGTGAGVMDACTNAADADIIANKDVKGITTTCGQTNLGKEPATTDCIKMGTGLSDDCTSCYAGEVACVSDHCLAAEGKCLTAPNDQLCIDCRKKYCVPSFEACSGNKAM